MNGAPERRDLEPLLAPIPGDSPTGASLRYDALPRQIAEARREDDPSLPQGQWEAALKRADWRLVESLCSDALATRSKDLQVAAWLAEAWVHSRGLEGLLKGLALIKALCEDFWTELHPQMEGGDAEYRAAPLAWMNEKLALAVRLWVPIAEDPSPGGVRRTLADWGDALRHENLLRQNPNLPVAADRLTRAKFVTTVSLTPPAFYARLRSDLSEAAAAVQGLERLIDERLGAASPGLRLLREAVQSMDHALREFGAQSPPEAPGKADAQTVEGDEMAPKSTAEQPVESLPRAGSGGPIRSREEAFQRLAEAAEYLQRTEPHSPCPYLVMRAVAWGRMPLTDLLEELVRSEGDLRQLHELLGMRPKR